MTQRHRCSRSPARSRCRALVASPSSSRSRAAAAAADAASTAPARRGAQIAVDQWRADVARQGLSVNYQGVGSTVGPHVLHTRTRSTSRSSEIPFQPAYRDRDGHRDLRRGRRSPRTGRTRTCRSSPAARRSCTTSTSTASASRTCGSRPTTIAKIFTGVITNWNDPAITADNRRLRVPEPPDHAGRPFRRLGHDGAVHRVHGEPDARRSGTRSASESGSTSTRARRRRCIPTSTAAIAQQLSDGVADFVAAPYNNGAITYVEYGYAQAARLPGRVGAEQGRATTRSRPRANVAIALQGRTHQPRPHAGPRAASTRNPDPRAYPVSSYSYMIVPTTTAAPFTTEKGDDARQVHPLLRLRGPAEGRAARATRRCRKNLVQVAFDAVRKIPGARRRRRRSTSAPTRRSPASSPTRTRRRRLRRTSRARSRRRSTTAERRSRPPAVR